MSPSSCPHSGLSYSPSAHAVTAGYKQPTMRQLTAAAGLRKGVEYPSETTFPAPLVLPGDELSYGYDPKDDPQNLRSWLEEPERNEITVHRKTIYVAAPPKIDSSVEYMRPWSQPVLGKKASKTSSTPSSSPNTDDIISYLSAFYHPLPIKRFARPTLRFSTWPDSPKTPHKIALATPTEATLIRSRQTPISSSPFFHQLNLSDLLDVCIAILPSDAYALLLLLDQDTYEETSDDFVCGRAYGGSRVAVVSSARYNPIIDKAMDVESEHAWPASHCSRYLAELSEQTATAPEDPPPEPSTGSKKKPKPKRAVTQTQRGQNETGSTSTNPIDLSSPTPPTPPNSPLRAALAASLTSTPVDLATLWLSRLAKTASHELGHCLGLDHCIYHACIMQATASLAEDARQPPYLCPVDLAKVLRATGAVDGGVERYRRLIAVCLDLGKGEGGIFGAYEGWLGGRIMEMEGGK